MYTKKVNDGYYQAVVRYDERLKYCPYGSAGVIKSQDGSIHLCSYTTRVISIDPDGLLECTGTYSATTRKHIAAFLREYAPRLCYYDAKEAAATGCRINIYTGARVPA